MSEQRRPCEGEIWTGPGGVRFEVLINAQHFVTADPLVVYREYRGAAGQEASEAGAGAAAGTDTADNLPAYVCTLEAFQEFMRPTGERVPEKITGVSETAVNVTKPEGKSAEAGSTGKGEKELTPEQAAFRESVFNRGAARREGGAGTGAGSAGTWAGENDDAEPFSEEEFMKAFFAAGNTDAQIAIINENWRNITDRIVDNISIVLDLSIRSGSIDDRLIDLTGCLRTKSRFEGKRDRLRGE